MHRALALASLTIFIAACVIHRLEVTPVDTSVQEPTTVVSPVKVHLHDGSTVVFPNGVSVERGVVHGDGRRYDLTLGEGTAVADVPTEQIAAIESYQTPVATGASAAATIGSSIGWIIGGSLLAVAIFGSCPTVYTLADTGPALEAELFSYSIAPSFQSRDVDRLGLDGTAHGHVDLEVRNEMLETHYIDRLELLEVVHEPGEAAYPDEDGGALVVADLIAPTSAVDQSGRDVRETIGAADAVAWSTPDERLASVGAEDLLDHVDLEFDVPASPEGRKDAALVLRMRNSLLSTVLLYDVMLKGQGYGALDWMGAELKHRRLTWLGLGLWYRDHMGMDIAVWRNGRYQKVKHVGDLGPIAWSERAVELPAGADGKLKVRLSFVADNWRIDRVALALHSKSAQARMVPVARAATPDGNRPDIPAFLANSDEQYLITQPRDSVRLTFDVGDAPPGKSRTWLLASEGYYTEWMRADWLTDGHLGRFEPGTAALTEAVALYAGKRSDMARQFEATKIPIR